MNHLQNQAGWRTLLRPDYRGAVALSAVVGILWVAWLTGHGNSDRNSAMRVGAVILAVLAYCLLARANGVANRVVRIAQALALVAALSLWMRETYVGALIAREWDFLSFYLDARVASARLNLYDPASYHSIVDSLGIEVTQDFRHEILDVGFKYPPPSAFIFLPLASFKISVANVVWHILVATSILVSGILVARLLTGMNRGDAVALGVTMALCLDSAVEVQPYGQTLALLACVIVFAILDVRPSIRAGIFTCVAVLIKPFMMVPALLMVTAKKWKAVAGTLIAGASLIGLSLAVFGAGMWVSFLGGNTAARIPAWQFSQEVNQSLLGVLLRATGSTGMPGEHRDVLIAYGILAAFVVIASLIVATRIATHQFRLAYAIVLVGAMIVYPGTLHYYAAVLLIPTMLILEAQRTTDSDGSRRVAFAGVLLILVGLSGFTAMVFSWGVLMLLALRRQVLAAA